MFVGTTGYQYPPRKYDLPPGLLRAGKNTLVIRVINSVGRGGFYEGKPYQLQGRRDTLDLRGSWAYYAVKGVIWYPGESNTGHPQEYAALFPALINDWRAQMQQARRAVNLPFLFVQLANYQTTTIHPVESNWAIVRNAQLKTLALSNTGMAVAIDLGEWNDIHPLNKADVGKRLALAAQHVAYGDTQVVASGPLYASMRGKGQEIGAYIPGNGWRAGQQRGWAAALLRPGWCCFAYGDRSSAEIRLGHAVIRGNRSLSGATTYPDP